MDSQRNFLGTFLYSFLIFALLLAVVALALFGFFWLGSKIFPPTILFQSGLTNLAIFSSLSLALVLAYFFYPVISSNISAQFLLSAAVLSVLVFTTLPSYLPSAEDQLRSPPGTERFQSVLDGTLFLLNDGSAVYQKPDDPRLITINQTAFSDSNSSFTHSESELNSPTSFRWLGPTGNASYFQPPYFLNDLLTDIQYTSAYLKSTLDFHNGVLNPVFFLGGFISLIFGLSLIFELRLPRLIRLILGIFLIRILLGIIKFSWWNANLILGQWIDFPESLHWIFGGWIPVALAFFFLMLKLYNTSLKRSVMEEAGG